jgi:GNAT superfamily N-acetyltransferase
MCAGGARADDRSMTPVLSPTRTVVRVATRDDVPRIAEVIWAANQEFAPVLGAVHPAYLTDLLDVEVRLTSGTVLVAETDGTVTGTATLYSDAGEGGSGWPQGWALSRALAVDPDARGHGTATALVRAVIARAMRVGADELCLHTADFMTAAIALYESLGFRRDPAHDFDATDYLGIDGAEPVNLLAYRLRLTGGRPAALRRLPTHAPWPARQHGDEILTPFWLAGR